MPCLFPVLSVPFMKTTVLKLTLGFGTGCFCCCGDDWLVFCGDVAAFWKNMRKSITLHHKLQLSVHNTEGTSRTFFFLWHHLKYILLPALCSHMDWTPALHAADLGLNLSRETGYKHWGFFVIFLSPSMQISENCLKLNYKGQKQTMHFTYVNVWLVSSSQCSLRYHHIKKN